jgi:flavin-dependent dehydrogenase
MLAFSRLELDQCLLNKALEKGAELIKEKVIDIKKKNHFWKLKTQKQTYSAKILIGADGVNSIVREKTIGSLDPKDKGLCFGYIVKGLQKEEITLSISPHRRGFAWAIPNPRQTSLGIGSSEIIHSHGLKQELDIFIRHNYPHAKLVSQWAAQIPNIKTAKTFRIPIAGANWILIGDAAGHVNPRAGEGILYALLDGELAALAVEERQPQEFNRLWRQAYGTGFFLDINMAKWV